MPRLILVLVAALVWATALRAQPAEPAACGSFRIAFDKDLQPSPYTGRVYVVLATSARPEPRVQMSNWFAPAQTLALDVRSVAAGGEVMLAGPGLGFPKAAGEVAPGEYWAQAVARRAADSPTPGQGPGDLYSKPVRVRFDGASDGAITLTLGEVVRERAVAETEHFKVFEMRSPLLSEFHGRDYTVRAGVVVPEGWAEAPERTWPTLVMIGGFGGSHREARMMAPRFAPADGTPAEFLFVAPDPTCGGGHSVFADSANNGPWGRMLVEELLPEIDRRFRGGGAESRVVSGISSGGWASLWLAVTYPEQFAQCWSHVPDPVDFRDFQRIDLYAPGANMYTDPRGARRPLARMGSRVVLWYDDFCRMEEVLGRGGQIGSFEWTFSPRGPDGLPRPLFDRRSGAVDPETARSWEKYDIRLVIERGWHGTDGGPGLRERLAGKLHVFAGAEDTFYLEGATRLLKEALAKLGSDAEVVIEPGMPHTMHAGGVARMIEALQALAAPAAEAVPTP